jgi:hypothetical protein
MKILFFPVVFIFTGRRQPFPVVLIFTGRHQPFKVSNFDFLVALELVEKI